MKLTRITKLTNRETGKEKPEKSNQERSQEEKPEGGKKEKRKRYYITLISLIN